MDAILQKIKADITSRPLISLLIVVTITAASALLTLALATLLHLNAPYDKTFNELNGAHLWLYFNRERIRARDIQQMASLPGVVASTGVQYSVQSRVRIGDTRVLSSLRVLPVDKEPVVNRLLIQQGRNLAARQKEIVANEDFGYFYQLALDDIVGITGADGKEVALPVAGFAYNPMWDTYRNVQPPYLYLSENTLRELFPDETTWEWSIGLRLADPEAVDEILTQIKAVLRPKTLDQHTDWRDVRTSAIFEMQLNFIFLAAFSVFAILATVLVVASSISSIVLSQFKQIGMLKAIGFTQNQILCLYLGQYLILSLLGSLLGLALGILLSPLAVDNIAASLNTTAQTPFDLLVVTLVFAIIPGIVVLATVGAAHRGAKANIIKAIAVGAEAPHQRAFWGVKLATKWGLPITFILGLDDVFARPWRSGLTGLNLTLGVMGIVFGLTLNETLSAYKADPGLLGIIYNAVVTRDQTSDSRTQHLLQTASGVEAFYGQNLVDAKTLGGQTFQLRAVEGNLAAFPFKIATGRFFQSNTYEAVAGQGLLDWLGLKVGDELTLILAEEDSRPVTWHIVGQYAEASNAGQMLMVSLPMVARSIKHLKPTEYYLKLNTAADVTELKQYLQSGRHPDLTFTVIEQAIPWSIFYLQVAIFTLAVILVGMALVNVFNTSLLAVQEKLRLVGVLKTLGMTPMQVVAMVNTTAGILGAGAVVLGIPLGLVFTQIMLTMLSNNFGFGEVEVSLNLFYLLLLVPLMIGISMAGSFIPGRQAAAAPIINVLRRE
jgi:putative ABC transport system permease protein